MKVVAVVVAYNRRELLLQSLDALAAQTCPLAGIVVVDNGSTDGSGDVAAQHPAKPQVLTLPRNTGGAGGFAVGMAHAVTALAADAVWLMDDDTMVRPTALEELVRAWEDYPGDLALASSRVIWTDGRDHPMNTPRRRLLALRRAIDRAALVGAKPIRTGSFVSMLVAAPAIKRSGLPRADYFLWNDDFEFSARLLRHGQGIYVPQSVAEHHTPRFAGSMDNPGERFYFEVRNKTWTFCWGGDFGPLDLVAYGAYTLYGWARVLLTGQDKAVLWRCLGRGLRDGLRRPPRSTAAVLAHLGPVSAEVRQVEAQARAEGREDRALLRAGLCWGPGGSEDKTGPRP